MAGGLVLALLISACVSAPETRKPQYTQRHYIFSVLLFPEKPVGSPHMDIALSLLRTEYPGKQAEYLNMVLYSQPDSELYKDRVFEEQRDNYRRAAIRSAQTGDTYSESDNWRYSETIGIERAHDRGIVVGRSIESYTGGAHPISAKHYYVLDMDEHIQLRVDDFFENFQEDPQLRDYIYEELRRYSRLEIAQSLSEGIFFSDEPELSFNFFITDEGFGLHWDQYQIAPYSQGAIEIVLPWCIVHPFMRHSGIELLTKFGIYPFNN